MAEKAHPGGCQCRAVRFLCHGAPISTSLCHCSMCRRQTGGPVSAFASFAPDRVEIVAGTQAVATYRSSGHAVRRFCRHCGSALFFADDAGVEIDVFWGAFDQPDALPPPQYQIHTADRVAWLDDLPRLTSYPGGHP